MTQMYKALAVLLALIVPQLAVAQTVVVGVPGSRAEGASAECRPYELGFTRDDAHRDESDEIFSDLWWNFGLGEDNSVVISLDDAATFTRVRVSFYGVVLNPTICAGEVEARIGDRDLGTISVPAECFNAELGDMYQGTAELVLDNPETSSILELVDVSNSFTDGGLSGYFAVNRIELSNEPASDVTVVAVGPRTHQLPAEGTTLGGFGWELDRAGVYTVRADGLPASIEVPWDPMEREIWSVELPGGSGAFLYSPSDEANPESRRVLFADGATGSWSEIATLGDNVENAWFDECAGALRVILSDGTQRNVSPDGSVTAPD